MLIYFLLIVEQIQTYFLGTTCIAICLAFSNLISHNSVLSAAKIGEAKMWTLLAEGFYCNYGKSKFAFVNQYLHVNMYIFHKKIQVVHEIFMSRTKLENVLSI